MPIYQLDRVGVDKSSATDSSPLRLQVVLPCRADGASKPDPYLCTEFFVTENLTDSITWKELGFQTGSPTNLQVSLHLKTITPPNNQAAQFWYFGLTKGMPPLAHQWALSPQSTANPLTYTDPQTGYKILLEWSIFSTSKDRFSAAERVYSFQNSTTKHIPWRHITRDQLVNGTRSITYHDVEYFAGLSHIASSSSDTHQYSKPDASLNEIQIGQSSKTPTMYRRRPANQATAAGTLHPVKSDDATFRDNRLVSNSTLTPDGFRDDLCRLIDQGLTNFCLPTCVALFLIKNEPSHYVRIIQSIYETGGFVTSNRLFTIAASHWLRKPTTREEPNDRKTGYQYRQSDPKPYDINFHHFIFCCAVAHTQVSHPVEFSEDGGTTWESKPRTELGQAGVYNYDGANIYDYTMLAHEILGHNNVEFWVIEENKPPSTKTRLVRHGAHQYSYALKEAKLADVVNRTATAVSTSTEACVFTTPGARELSAPRFSRIYNVATKVYGWAESFHYEDHIGSNFFREKLADVGHALLVLDSLRQVSVPNRTGVHYQLDTFSYGEKFSIVTTEQQAAYYLMPYLISYP